MPLQPQTGSRRSIPASIWMIGFVSLFMDISSEMIHALLPVYLVTVMGASTLAVGFIEGIAEATASIVKVFSGAISDWLGKRKLLAIVGYGLAAITKPVFPLAPAIEWLIAARFVDRVGKGIRGAPRDALVAELAPKGLRGASFGLRQMLDTIGAFAGPLMAIALMFLFAGDFQAVFWIAVIPAFLSVAILVFGVREAKQPAGPGRKARFPLQRSELKRLALPFWLVVIVAVVFSLARFSEAFLILRAQGAGMSVAMVPLVLVVMNAAFALSAYPAGALSDRANRLTVLIVGYVLLIGADLVLAFASTLPGILAGVAIWGLHMGLTQGLLTTLVADTAQPELRGTAFGIFNLLSGLALLAASVMAGLLWDIGGPQWTFLAGAAATLAGLAGLLLIRWRMPQLGEGETP